MKIGLWPHKTSHLKYFLINPLLSSCMVLLHAHVGNETHEDLFIFTNFQPFYAFLDTSNLHVCLFKKLDIELSISLSFTLDYAYIVPYGCCSVISQTQDSMWVCQPCLAMLSDCFDCCSRSYTKWDFADRYQTAKLQTFTSKYTNQKDFLGVSPLLRCIRAASEHRPEECRRRHQGEAERGCGFNVEY